MTKYEITIKEENKEPERISVDTQDKKINLDGLADIVFWIASCLGLPLKGANLELK